MKVPPVSRLHVFRFHSKALPLLLSIICALISAPCLAEEQALSSSAVLDKKLPALDSILAPGNNFNREAIETLLIKNRSNSGEWYRIPIWLAGKWAQSQGVCTYSRDERTGKCEEDERSFKSEAFFTKGDQVDRKGNPWQRLQYGYMTETDYGESTAYNFVQYFKPIELTADCMSFKGQSVTVVVHKVDKKIVDTHTIQILQRQRRVAETILEKESAQRTFDWKGEPTFFSITLTDCTKVGTFRTNRKSDFVAFLKSKGLESLIPR